MFHLSRNFPKHSNQRVEKNSLTSESLNFMAIARQSRRKTSPRFNLALPERRVNCLQHQVSIRLYTDRQLRFIWEGFETSRLGRGFYLPQGLLDI